MEYQSGGLKYVFFYIISLQCSRLTRLFDNSFHQLKVKPLFFIHKTFAYHFKFHSNVDLGKDTIKFFLWFCKSICLTWKSFFNVNPSSIPNPVLWLGKFIQINNQSVCYKRFLLSYINFLMQMVDRNGLFKD